MYNCTFSLSLILIHIPYRGNKKNKLYMRRCFCILLFYSNLRSCSRRKSYVIVHLTYTCAPRSTSLPSKVKHYGRQPLCVCTPTTMPLQKSTHKSSKPTSNSSPRGVELVDDEVKATQSYAYMLGLLLGVGAGVHFAFD